MQTAKENVRRLLSILPDDCTLEDIQYHLLVMQKIELGLKELDEGKGIPNEEVERRLAKWLSK